MHHEIITSLELDTSILVMMTLRIVKVTRVFAERKRPFCCPPPPFPPVVKVELSELWLLLFSHLYSLLFVVVFPQGEVGWWGIVLLWVKVTDLRGCLSAHLYFHGIPFIFRHNCYLVCFTSRSFCVCRKACACISVGRLFVGIRCLCFSVYWHQIQCSPFQVVFMVFGILWLSLSL